MSQRRRDRADQQKDGAADESTRHRQPYQRVHHHGNGRAEMKPGHHQRHGQQPDGQADEHEIPQTTTYGPEDASRPDKVRIDQSSERVFAAGDVIQCGPNHMSPATERNESCAPDVKEVVRIECYDYQCRGGQRVER